MDREKYIRVMDFIRSHKYGVNIIYITGKSITYLTAVIYLLIITLLIYKEDMRFIRVIAVPAASFTALSVFRAKYNAIRPYEKYNFKPLIPKDTHGKSFPSRHVFSIFICAGAASYIYPVPGMVIYIMGILLAVIRVISGVHFPRDVIAGALAGVLCSIAGFTDL
ncbi:MAG: phosphatase PAP2 family protein [Lachnospiraceae bacterium]|nr:phosphatase PAP2 family protein [Lachnospiraceae bacterium]